MIKKLGRSELASKLKLASSYRNIEKQNSINVEKNTLFDLGFEAELLSSLSKIDDYTGIFNTSQLKDSVDFSKFENHTFYDSAEAKVNYAFSRVINNFPFEGTFEEYSDYISNLDGFTSHILDLVDKNKGYLKFNNSFIEVKDQNGYLFSTSNKKNKGSVVLDPETSQFSFEFWLYIPDDSLDANQIVFQKKSSAHDGFTCYIEQNTGSEATLSFLVSNKESNTQDFHSFVKDSITIKTNTFTHICINIKNTLGKRVIQFIKDGKKQVSNNLGSGLEIQKINFKTESLYIGKGETHIVDSGNVKYGSYNVNSVNNLTAYIDEFRVYHSVRSEKLVKQENNKNIFKRKDLKLYFRFNEPSGNYANVSLVIDSSGNSLHSQIKYFNNPTVVLSNTDANTLRSLVSNIAIPLDEEDENFSPVLFPDYPDTVSLRNTLLSDANLYDENNPNLIFKLFPKQFFDGQSQEEGFDSLYGNISSPFGYKEAIAGSVTLPAIGNFVSLLLIWARFYDNLKVCIDSYTEIINLDYENLSDNRPGSSVFIPKIASYLGIDFKQILNSPTSRNLLGKDLQYNNSTSSITLRKIQNTLWKRILINSQDFLRSKGTSDSIRSIIKNAGVDPDLFYEIREKSGLDEEKINESYFPRKSIVNYIDFSNNILETDTFSDENTFSSNKPFFEIFNLNNSTNGNNPGDFQKSNEAGALNDSALSGSWTCETYVQFPQSNLSNYNLNQSLGRILSKNSESSYFPLFNIISKRENLSDNNTTLYFLGRPYDNASAEDIVLSSSNDIPLFDGNIWKISYGRKKTLKGYRNKSTYFLSVDKCGLDFKNYFNLEKSFFSYNDSLSQEFLDLQQKNNSDYNLTENNFAFHVGSFSFSSSVGDVGDTTLSAISISGIDELTTTFQGRLIKNNIYSLDLDRKTLDDHAKDIESIGVLDPTTNYNFISQVTGSNQRLISSTDFKTIVSSSWDGQQNKANLLDYTQNLNITSSISHKTLSIKPESLIQNQTFYSNKLISAIDNSNEFNKVRILSSDNSSIYERANNFKTNEENRFIVEISNINALNNDISNMLSSLDEFNNTLGDTSNLFDVQYKNINNIRTIYFKNLKDEIDNRSLYFIYKYMDNLISDLIRSVIPDKVNYSGHNYTITSHSLERHKIQYKYNESRLPEQFRTAGSVRLNKQNRLR